jgi:DNA-binding MarR family transcriptional regulator
MDRTRTTSLQSNPSTGVAFLLSQVGAHASAGFAERLEPLGLKPSHAGILRVLSEADGLSQQALAEKLGTFASRIVGLIDEIESRGLVERRDNPADRRSYAVYLTTAGRDAFEQILRVASSHQDAICAALEESERAQLAHYLERIAAAQGLTPGVHPAFRRLGP